MLAITREQLRDQLAADPVRIDHALKAVGPTGTSVGLEEFGPSFGVRADEDPGKFCTQLIAYLTDFRLIDRFSAIVFGRSAAGQSAAERANSSTTLAAGETFFHRTVWARCSIYRDLQFQGSGCLVGPTLVLTCAHVIGKETPAVGYDKLEVKLETGARISLAAAPVAFASQSSADSVDPLSANDDDYTQDDDFALLRMRVPAGANTAVIAMPDMPPWIPTANAKVQILHFPDGQDEGVGDANLATFAAPSARWSYSAPTLPGSSGGACFNSNGVMIGIHQGAIANGKRMVPLARFIERIRPQIAQDYAPHYLWSLTGRLGGALVIGRDDLFAAFGLLSTRDSVQRGLRVRRVDPTGPDNGLGYSVELLKQLIARRPDGHQALILSWPQATFDTFDLIGSLARQASEQKLVDPQVAIEHPGGATGETGATTVAVARTDQLVRALHAKACETGQLLWLIVEHANVELNEHVIALESLVTMALQWPTLRVAIIGNETLRLPEPEFRISDVAAGGGAKTDPAQTAPAGTPATPSGAGYLVEYLDTFARADVTTFICRVYHDFLGREPDPALAERLTDKALKDVAQIGSAYSAASLGQVATRLRDLLDTFEPLS